MIPKERLQRLQAMLESNPNDSFLTFALAKEWEKQGKMQEALALYRRLVQRDPDYVGTYYHLGKLLEALSRPEEAIQAYEDGMQTARKVADHHALQELAGARLQLADPDE